jgi:prevent-host-death family protein
MGKTWQLQEAKNRLSEVVDKALAEGPQVISRRGKEAVVVLAADEYARLTQPPTSLLEFFENSPLYGADLLPIAGQKGGKPNEWRGSLPFHPGRRHQAAAKSVQSSRRA